MFYDENHSAHCGIVVLYDNGADLFESERLNRALLLFEATYRALFKSYFQFFFFFFDCSPIPEFLPRSFRA